MKIRFVFILLWSTSAWCQTFSSDVWHEGFAITVSHDTLKGDIKYNIEDNYITVKKNEKLTALSNQKLLKFVIRDKVIGSLRTFYSLPYSVLRGKKPYLIFEILLEAPETLMAREKIVTEFNQPNIGYYNYPLLQRRDVLQYDLYFLSTKGEITTFGGKKKELLSYVGPKYQSKIKEFIQKEKIKTERPIDMVKLFRYYNQLKYKID